MTASYQLPVPVVKMSEVDLETFMAYRADYLARNGDRPTIDTTPMQHLDGINLETDDDSQ